MSRTKGIPIWERTHVHKPYANKKLGYCPKCNKRFNCYKCATNHADQFKHYGYYGEALKRGEKNVL